MTTLLQINASLFAGHGQSSQLADRFVATYLAAHPGSSKVVRDVASDPVPHLDGRRFAAFTTPAAERTAEQNAVIDYSDALIAELKSADVLVIGLPMYNFGVPSQLKSWIDHIARAGETFRYTAEGPVGLVTGKKVYVFATRGGLYVGTPLDTQTSYVRDFLRFIGITDVEFVYAEGIAYGPEQKDAAIAKANDAIAKLAA
ncbi:FMN-dependent NADH-azoreductase [Nevskia ramosa]|uniref:FMN-dependent NADH-azoreductase n=1 Tax=Nevskia ramosa TaxID=64002 RepID=UPI0023547CDD|nr:FMN-dependent NADH-azoreductase [Nevskia ramosa]